MSSFQAIEPSSDFELFEPRGSRLWLWIIWSGVYTWLAGFTGIRRVSGQYFERSLWLHSDKIVKVGVKWYWEMVGWLQSCIDSCSVPVKALLRLLFSMKFCFKSSPHYEQHKRDWTKLVQFAGPVGPTNWHYFSDLLSLRVPMAI